MLGAIILFTLIVILPYLLYFRQRYKKSKNKKQFMRENLYRSTLWIMLLVVVPLCFVNLFWKSPSAPVDLMPDDQSLSLADYQKVRQDSQNIDFHYEYITRFCEKDRSASLKNDITDYYRGFIRQGLPDLGHWGLGYFYLKDKKPDSVLTHLHLVQNQKMKYQNLAIGDYFKQQKKDSLSIHYWLREAKLSNGAKNLVLPPLVDQLQLTEDLHLLLELKSIPEASDYLHTSLARKIFFVNNRFADYYSEVIGWFTSNIDTVGFFAALFILIVWSTYLIKLAFFEKVNWALLLSILVLGMVFSFFTLPISDFFHYTLKMWDGSNSVFKLFLYSVFGIGAVEELVKVIPLLIILLFTSKKLQPYEYILLASMSAMGFAFIENLIYFDGYYGHIIHGRALTAAVGHMIDSSIFAYGLVLVKFKEKKSSAFGVFMLFWFLAALVHGLYDFWLFTQLILIFILFFFLIARVWNTLLNNCINNSEHFKYTSKFKTKPIQFFLTFWLTAILMFEYLVVAYMDGAEVANQSIAGAAFSGSFLIMFLGSKLTSLNLIRGYWAKVNFSINPFTDDVVSQNFIGNRVILSSYYADRGLVEYFPDGVTGTIVKRVVLLNRQPTFFMSHDDSEWFIVRLDTPLPSSEFKSNQVLIKFKEAHSSLNAKKFFLVLLLLIPEEIPVPKRMRKNFTSLGWTFLKTPDT